jgi:putative thioredoxin
MGQDGVMQQPRNFSLHGAVDLGARQAAAKRRQQAAPAPATGDGQGSVIEVTEETFNTEVVGRSRTVPVIVDLWADWCQPCKQLGPVLEKLADEAAGAWVLAKVDVDANQQLAAALQVQSIPMVVAVIGGQLVDGFLGALPEPQVRQWLDQIMQVAEQLGLPARGAGQETAAQANGSGGADAPDQAAAAVPGSPGGPGMGGRQPADVLSDPGLAAAQQAMDAGDLDAAATALRQVLDGTPGHPVATAWLAQVELIRRVGGYDRAKVRRAASDLPDDPDAQAKAADLELASGQVEAAFERMLRVVGRTSGPERDQARRHLLSLFEIMPPRDPQVSKARARLSSLLF